MIVVIGNGQSRSVFSLNLLENHITYGCNAVYRDYSPTYLVCGDHHMIWDICYSGYSKKGKCGFKTFEKIPAFNYEMIKSMFPPGYRILETTPRTNEFVTFEIGKVPGTVGNGDIAIYWVAEDEETKQLDWWGEEENTSYNSGTAALRLACLNHPKEDIYCIGFDYYLDRTADNIYLGSRHYRYATNIIEANQYFDSKKNDPLMSRDNWIKRHKRIEEEFDNRIYHVGKHLNYIEFEELLNK